MPYLQEKTLSRERTNTRQETTPVSQGQQITLWMLKRVISQPENQYLIQAEKINFSDISIQGEVLEVSVFIAETSTLILDSNETTRSRGKKIFKELFLQFGELMPIEELAKRNNCGVSNISNYRVCITNLVEEYNLKTNNKIVFSSIQWRWWIIGTQEQIDAYKKKYIIEIRKHATEWKIFQSLLSHLGKCITLIELAKESGCSVSSISVHRIPVIILIENHNRETGEELKLYRKQWNGWMLGTQEQIDAYIIENTNEGKIFSTLLSNLGEPFSKKELAKRYNCSIPTVWNYRSRIEKLLERHNQKKNKKTDKRLVLSSIRWKWWVIRAQAQIDVYVRQHSIKQKVHSLVPSPQGKNKKEITPKMRIVAPPIVNKKELKPEIRNPHPTNVKTQKTAVTTLSLTRDNLLPTGNSSLINTLLNKEKSTFLRIKVTQNEFIILFILLKSEKQTAAIKDVRKYCNNPRISEAFLDEIAKSINNKIWKTKTRVFSDNWKYSLWEKKIKNQKLLEHK